MNLRHNIIALLCIVGTPTFQQAAFIQELKNAQQNRGIRVATPEELQFEQKNSVHNIKSMLPRPFRLIIAQRFRHQLL